jgi:L,D-transpeptidase YcbB
MGQEAKAPEDSNPVDQLALLVLRVVAELSPTTKTSLIDYVSRGISTPERGQIASDSLTGELISNALLKLQAIALIQVDHEQIAITDEPSRSLEKLPAVASRPRWPYTRFTSARGSTSIIFGSVLLVVVLSAVGGAAFLSAKHAERSQAVSLLEGPDRSGAPADAGGPAKPALNTPMKAAATQALGDDDGKPAKAVARETGEVEQNIIQPVAEQVTTDPIVATIRAKLSDPALRQDAQSEDLAALQSFYAARSGPSVWMMGIGFTTRAQAVISEIRDADAWGLSADAIKVPSAGDLPATEDAQATDEIRLQLAILKYARYARGGRLTPSRISDLLDQTPNLLDPKTVLTEISTSALPDAYLRSLHPREEQFERLRQALLKARARNAAGGTNPGNEREIQWLIINMERWRWLSPGLGSYYVWDNIPEFLARVVKNGKTIYVEKTIVGQLNHPTPIFSSEMRSIVFHPEWVVPETIIREDLEPSLRQSGFLGGLNTAILEEHNLKVSSEGRPVDPSRIDWMKANIWHYTFTQAPGPDNVLGVLKFNFPNKHAIYMHDTTQPELFAETVRTLSHGCIRVRNPARLAALLLAEDKGWSAPQVNRLLAKNTSSLVPLTRPLPVHLAYFTAVVDEHGKVQTFADVYGLDGKIGAALFGKGVKLKATTVEADAPDGPRKSSWRAAERTGSLADSMAGLFGN